MSEVIWALVGTVLGAGIAIIPSWLDRMDRLRVMTFEKRLDKHQEAFALCQQLAVILYVEDRTDREDQLDAEIRAFGKRLYLWWNENCFYLDRQSSAKIATLSRACMKQDGISESGFFGPLEDARHALQNGIGHKHLEKTDDRY